ncbi:hypothetical protein T484DRAFT_1791658 [Baffinella frigidus]|nr:hypothetical protein T484DRAFT_1791658 [Cryptophyta sp. CCMP2293]
MEDDLILDDGPILDDALILHDDQDSGADGQDLQYATPQQLLDMEKSDRAGLLGQLKQALEHVSQTGGRNLVPEAGLVAARCTVRPHKGKTAPDMKNGVFYKFMLEKPPFDFLIYETANVRRNARLPYVLMLLRKPAGVRRILEHVEDAFDRPAVQAAGAAALFAPIFIPGFRPIAGSLYVSPEMRGPAFAIACVATLLAHLCDPPSVVAWTTPFVARTRTTVERAAKTAIEWMRQRKPSVGNSAGGARS